VSLYETGMEHRSYRESQFPWRPRPLGIARHSPAMLGGELS
jgi:hypothetical protein